MSRIASTTTGFATPPRRWDWPRSLAIWQEGAPAWRSLAAYALLALVFRAFLLGNPIVHVDEEFYLDVARRWQQGALPYIDVWDRKPIGLFVLYRVFLLAPGDGVLAYQIAGIVFTALTALVVERLAREIAPPRAAWLAGAAYVLYLPVFNCALGQGPVFYNLPVALAALGVVEAWKRTGAPDLITRGAQVMLLIGLAIQIKTCVVFEGIAFGLMLLARCHADGWGLRRMAGAAAVWIGVALLPSLLPLVAYTIAGHGSAYVQATMLSVFQRLPDGSVAGARLLKETLALTPFLLAIFHAPRHLAPTEARPVARRALKVWAAAAVVGFLLFGTWYDHYVGPLLPPLAVLAAPALGRLAPEERWYTNLLLGFGAIAGTSVMTYQAIKHGNGAQVEQLTERVRSEMRGGCYFQFDGEPVFYRTVNACVPTRFAFPNHLDTFTEAPALGVDANREVVRIMMSRPDVVQIGEWKNIYLQNYLTRAIVKDFLTRDYERYAGVRVGTRMYGLWRLRPHLRTAGTAYSVNYQGYRVPQSAG